MPDRRVGDWRNGVDIDEEMADWDRTTRRAQVVVAAGLAVAAVFLVAFALNGTGGGVEYMAGAMFFMAAFAGVLVLLRRRFASAVRTLDTSRQPAPSTGDRGARQSGRAHRSESEPWRPTGGT